MKIAFITGSLEPGRDGVGDYTSSFADELRLQGHDTIIIALRDKFVSKVTAAGRQVAGKSIQTFRLPVKLPWPECIREARQILDSFDPEWVSLQFVCYSFHRKGLVHGLARRLAPLLTGRKLHIMFHELWIGDHTGAALKETIVGWVQRSLILRVVSKLQPSAVSTSNATYFAMLKEHGITAFFLPLFGNIPIVKQSEHDWLFSLAATQGLMVNPENRSDFWIFGLFGGLHSAWPEEPLFTMLREASAQYHKRMIVASVGRIGVDSEYRWEVLVRNYGKYFGFLRVGEQSPKRVSEFLHWVDYGIATSPWMLIEKSGSVAAMIEHGLPVIVNRDDWYWRGGNVLEIGTNPLLHKLDATLARKLAAGLPKREPSSSLPKVARTLIETFRITDKSHLT
jgi:hypothetical protein